MNSISHPAGLRSLPLLTIIRVKGSEDLATFERCDLAFIPFKGGGFESFRASITFTMLDISMTVSRPRYSLVMIRYLVRTFSVEI